MVLVGPMLMDLTEGRKIIFLICDIDGSRHDGRVDGDVSICGRPESSQAAFVGSASRSAHTRAAFPSVRSP